LSDAPAADAVTPVEATAAPAQETDWKAEARKWEARAKENISAASRLAEIEEASKSEAQKLADRAAAAEKTASEKDRALLKLQVIVDYGIPKDYQDLVHGDTAEALAESAKKVQSLIKANAEPAVEPQQTATFVIPDEGRSPNLALNGDGLESALKNALGIK
jgi:hypothetical protein